MDFCSPDHLLDSRRRDKTPRRTELVVRMIAQPAKIFECSPNRLDIGIGRKGEPQSNECVDLVTRWHYESPPLQCISRFQHQSIVRTSGSRTPVRLGSAKD